MELTKLQISSKVPVDDIVKIRKRSNAMPSNQPWDFKPALTAERLNFLAGQFWEVYYAVESLLITEDDCNYGRGALFFGRARKRLINLSFELDWLKLTNSGMDVTLELAGVPFRFFRDEHENPKKKGFWRRNESDQLFAPNDHEPVIFRFIVQRPISEQDELEVYFIGYNALEEPICEWRYGQVPVLIGVDQRRPTVVEQPAAPVDVPEDHAKRDSDDKESLG